MSNEEPKLIIDEDWKSQVQREKELFKQRSSTDIAGLGAAQAQTDAAEPTSLGNRTIQDEQAVESVGNDGPSEITQSNESSSANSARKAPTQQDQPLPPASFELLVSGLATQAIASLGQLPGEDGQTLPCRPELARHFIDLLGVLEAKSIGNLTDVESEFLKSTLHQLRMLFIAATK